MDSQLIDFKNESNRLGTFAGWPVSFIISPKSLAAAGFYYTKQTDKVKCAFCDICICRWEFGDNAVDEHKRHNPNCSFILSQDCGNIPIIEGIQLRGEFVENHKETGEPIDIRGLGVRAHRVAHHLNYNSYCARLKTFRGWKNKSQKPEDLATAGFFFTGSNDEVRCYYCDGGLQNWEVADNAWVEHAVWFPNCGFLNLVKGDKFLDGSLAERFNALLSKPRSDDPTSSSQEGHMVSIHQTDNGSSNNMRYSTTRHETFDYLAELMLAPPARAALELGLQPSQIKQAIRNNLQDIGRPFRSLNNFIQQILNENESSFPMDGDSMTLEEMLQREEPLSRTNNTHRHDPTSDESSESDETHESNDSFYFVSELDDLNHEVPDLQNENMDSQNENMDSQNENETPDNNESMIVADNENENETPDNNETMIVASYQNENETPDIHETIIVTDNVESSQSSDIKVIEEVNLSNVEPESIKLSQSDLEEEIRRLKEARLCKICLDQELGVVMLPCAHLVSCITCASSLPDCPLCRQTIKATVRTFLS